MIEETYKSGGVVISDGLGITKSLQGRVTLDDLILQGTLESNNPTLIKMLKTYRSLYSIVQY